MLWCSLLENESYFTFKLRQIWQWWESVVGANLHEGWQSPLEEGGES